MTDAQFDELMRILGEIKQALSFADLPEADACQHPENLRVSLRSGGDPDHWFCNGCKTHFGARVMMQ